MNATSKNRSAILRHLRKQAAAEEDQEKLRSIAVQVLRVLKRDDSPSAVHPWTEKVRSLRKKLRFSQTQLAAKLMTVSRWERGRQELPTRCLVETGKLAGPSEGWAFWNMAGITIEDVRAMLNGQAAGKP
jgi:DNA-binding transcriptional regulator YiaG